LKRRSKIAQKRWWFITRPSVGVVCLTTWEGCEKKRRVVKKMKRKERMIVGGWVEHKKWVVKKEKGGKQGKEKGKGKRIKIPGKWEEKVYTMECTKVQKEDRIREGGGREKKR